MASKRSQSKNVEAEQALSELKTHQIECALRYERIEERLEEGSEKFKRLERLIWGVYPFIAISIFATKFL